MEHPEPTTHFPSYQLHPLTLLQQMIKSLPALLMMMVAFLSVSSWSEGWFLLAPLMLLYCIVVVPPIVIRYLRFRYWITGREVIIHSGILTRRKRNIPLERIQNVIIERSLLPRLMGTAAVKIETAGSKDAEGILEYVRLDEAKRIRAIIRHHQREDAPATPEISRKELFTMSLSRVLLSGAFRFSLLYLALVFSGLQFLREILGITPDEVTLWLTSETVEDVAATAKASPWIIGAITVSATILLGWITGTIVNLTKYFGFRLWLEDDKLHRKHGLLTVREGTIPLKRIQSLILRSNPLMHAFGWYQVELQTVGYNVEKQGYQVAMPFVRMEEILTLAPHIRPFTLPETFERVSPINIRRTFLRYSMVLLVILTIPAIFWQHILWCLLGIPLLLYLAILQYRNHGYAFAGDILYIKRGVFRQYLWIVPTERMQAFYTKGSPFQRRLGLRSLVVDTAGAGSFRYPCIVDLNAETAEILNATMYGHFQAHFAP